MATYDEIVKELKALKEKIEQRLTDLNTQLGELEKRQDELLDRAITKPVDDATSFKGMFSEGIDDSIEKAEIPRASESDETDEDFDPEKDGWFNWGLMDWLDSKVHHIGRQASEAQKAEATRYVLGLSGSRSTGPQRLE